MLNFLEEEAQCSKEEKRLLEQRDNIDWDSELTWLLKEAEPRERYPRKDRIRECGRVVHSIGVNGGHVTAVYRCGCLECPKCFEDAKEGEIMRLKSALSDGPLYITIISAHKGNAAKKHMQRHKSLYRRYPSTNKQDVYVIDEAARRALASHSRTNFQFKELKQPSLKWKRVLAYVPGKKRSGSLGKPRVSKEVVDKIRIITPRVTVSGITAQQKRAAWLEALIQTPGRPELTVRAIQDACELRFNKWIAECEKVGGMVREFGVQVRLVRESQLTTWISCDIDPFDLFISLPDYVNGVAVGIKEPEREFA